MKIKKYSIFMLFVFFLTCMFNNSQAATTDNIIAKYEWNNSVMRLSPASGGSKHCHPYIDYPWCDVADFYSFLNELFTSSPSGHIHVTAGYAPEYIDATVYFKATYNNLYSNSLSVTSDIRENISMNSTLPYQYSASCRFYPGSSARYYYCNSGISKVTLPLPFIDGNNILIKQGSAQLLIDPTMSAGGHLLNGYVEIGSAASSNNIDSLLSSTSTNSFLAISGYVVLRTPDGLTSEVYGGLSGSASGTVTRKINPNFLTASFSKYSEELGVEKKFNGIANDISLGEIYLLDNNSKCPPGPMCDYSLTHSSSSITCNDSSVELAIIPSCYAGSSTQCVDGKIGTIYGTWGRVNVDTNCSISVVIPYE
ncbi:hypothetical protein [Salmonella enterica]|uniref:hypothetical protein n=1 Tax=Salmonella enterica TaxID=28901 RepID=UPI00111BE4B8|nr:hypothetical protein [Salmonella enterica]HBC0155079.1 hypothetical protein [Salmonella enterica subsp. indica]